MKIGIMTLLLLSSLSVFSQVLEVSCEKESTTVQVKFDFEDGEGFYNLSIEEKKFLGAMNHIENDSEAMEIKGAAMELFGIGLEGDFSSRLSIFPPSNSGKVEAVLAYAVSEDSSEEFAIDCDVQIK